MVTKSLLEAMRRGGTRRNPHFPQYYLFRLKKGSTSTRKIPTMTSSPGHARLFHEEEPDLRLQDLPSTAFMMRGGLHGLPFPVIANRHGAEVSTGRGNLSFTTINLPALPLRPTDTSTYSSRNSSPSWIWLPGSCIPISNSVAPESEEALPDGAKALLD